MADQQEIHITFTPKQAIGVIVALVAIFGSYPVANMVTPGARALAFTSEDGEELEERINLLEAELMQFKQLCEKRYDGVKLNLATNTADIKHHENTLRECVRRTQ